MSKYEIDRRSYDEYFEFLKEKYGNVQGNYFVDEKFKEKNKQIKRWVNEGLNVHHYYEYKCKRLCKTKEIWEWIYSFDKNDRKKAYEEMKKMQNAENLCYADLLEHSLLHVKILDKMDDKTFDNAYFRVYCDNLFNGYNYTRQDYLRVKQKNTNFYEEYLSIHRELSYIIMNRKGYEIIKHFTIERFDENNKKFLYLFNINFTNMIEHDFNSLRISDITRIFFEEIWNAWNKQYSHEPSIKSILREFKLLIFYEKYNFETLIDLIEELMKIDFYDVDGYATFSKLKKYYSYFNNVKKDEYIDSNILYTFLYLYTRIYNCTNHYILSPILLYIIIRQIIKNNANDSKLVKICDECNNNLVVVDTFCRSCYFNKMQCKNCKSIICTCGGDIYGKK